MGKTAVVLICFSRMFAQSYPCCPRTFGTALVDGKSTNDQIFLLLFWVKLVLPELFALNYGCVLLQEVTIKDSLS